MLRFQEKRRIQRFLSSKITIAALLVMIFFVARGTWGVYLKERDSEKSLEVAQRAYDELDARQKSLSGQIAELQTSRGVEGEIRSRYEVARPGEEVALIVDDATDSTSTVPTERSWWQQLVSWVTDK